MRRVISINTLLVACLVAAFGLAYWSFRLARQVANQDQQLLSDTLRELAEEKVFGIESQLVSAERAVFDAIQLEPLSDLAAVVGAQGAPVLSIFVLGPDGKVLPGGYAGRAGAAGVEFGRFFASTILPELGLDRLGVARRGHWHGRIDGREYLFAFVRRRVGDQVVSIVLEEDLARLVGEVMPEFFTWQSPQSARWFQVMDAESNLVFGYPFRDLADAVVVEIPFAQTATRWRLRVAQRDDVGGRARSQRTLIDLALIGIAFATIFGGLAVLTIAIRRERKANDVKSDFVSSVSHELKTPLSIISLFGEMLADGRAKSPEQVAEYASKIRRESVHLSQLIDNVLDFAQMERGVSAYQMAPTDLRDVVSRALELAQHRLAGTDVLLSSEMPDGPLLVQGDGNALALAVLNLIDNAIKYAAGGQRILVSAIAHPNHAELHVRDWGPGIDPTESGHIFERFYRASNARASKARGSGIGLALVAHIAAAHHGEVGVIAAAPTGCDFWLKIPRARAMESA